MRKPRTGGVLQAVFAVCLIVAQLSFGASDTETNQWWSFKPVTRPSLPPAASWSGNEIDRFIFTKLKENAFSPSPEADRRTLIRRVTFNLTGLPPTPEEVRAFIEDPSTKAYEKVVDRLLASPRYGERWARHWLDTVHFGETHGYDKDKPRLNAWPYRDYVIGALNSDKPYSRFVQEQLAADVLFPDEPKLIPALGFIAAGPWDFVGHVELPITKTDGLIARYNDRDDMVMNAMSTFQSLTVHCARCHDHKFDPISQREYYALQAVFAGVDRADRPFDADAVIARERRELTRQLAELKSERKQLDDEVVRRGGDTLRALDARIAEVRKSSKPNRAAFGYHSQISLSPDTVKWVQVDLGEAREIDRLVYVGCHDDFNNLGAGFGFPLRYRIEVSDDAEFGAATIVQDRSTADVANPGVSPQQVKVGRSARFVRFTATRLAPRKDDFIFALAELLVLDKQGSDLARGAMVTALDSIEAPPRWRRQNLVDGYYVGVENTSNRALADLQAEREQLIRALVPGNVAARLQGNEWEQVETNHKLGRLPKQQMVYAAASDFPANGAFIPAKGPRPVHFLRRGDVKRSAEEMQPGTLSAVPGVPGELSIDNPASEGERRAALARWLTHTNNLLARRSIVNRVWHYHFGRGIVETPNDFGRMGAEPSHPELLDWLAFWFVENGESLKKLHRLIVTSATYRQVVDGAAGVNRSKVPEERASVTVQPFDSATNRPSAPDSQNRLLWRMNRVRLDAEQFHDALLAISGDIDLAMGGPSVQQFRFKDDHSPVYDYADYDWNSPGANRRSIYRFIVRSVPDPFMDALDCPDANILTPVRNTTMTALQALAALNDPFVVRQSERFAVRLQRERSTLEEQVSRAYELALARSPNPTEQARLTAHARRHGLASLCRVIFNSNEFMFVD